jgi:hypothetical protein
VFSFGGRVGEEGLASGLHPMLKGGRWFENVKKAQFFD